MFQPLALIDSIPAILWTADSATLAFTWVSRGAEQLLGYPCEEWLQSPTFWRDHIHPDDRRSVITAVQSDKGGDQEIAYRMIASNGRVVNLRDIVSSRTVDGRRELFGVMFDVTAERKAHDALAQSEANYRRLVHTSPDAIGVHTKGRYIYANPKFVEIFGAHHESEIIGRDVYTFVHSDFREIVRQRLVSIAVGDIVPMVHEKMVRLDGRVIDAEVMAIPVVFDGASAVQVVIRDVTDRMRTDERLRLLAAGTNEAIWEGDYTSNSFWTNDQFRRLLGDAPDLAAAQRIWQERLHPEDRDAQIARLKERIERGVDHWTEEYRIRTLAGEYIRVLERGRRVVDANGKPIRVIGAMLDLTPFEPR